MPPPDPFAAAPPPARILVRGVNWLGDAVMTTPALQRLRERFPLARITLLAPAKQASLWLHQPCIDAAVSFSPGQSVLKVGRQLRAERFDLALVLPNSPRSALECWLGRIPQRVGYAQYWRNWWLTQPVSFRPEHLEMRKRSVREIRRINRAGERPTEPPPSAHQIHDYLHLAAALGANPAPLPPLLRVTASEIAQAQATLLQALTLRTNVPPDLSLPLLGLNPGAEYGPAKRWPLENFIAAARQISRRLGPCHWLVFGGLQDWRVCHQITQSMGGSAVNLAGRTSLREFMGLLSLCRVLLTNDTGPMHVAAALGTPVVVPFGSTSSALTGPGLPGNPLHHLLAASAACAPCFRRACPIDFRCMTRLGTHRVVEAVLTAASGRR